MTVYYWFQGFLKDINDMNLKTYLETSLYQAILDLVSRPSPRLDLESSHMYMSI